MRREELPESGGGARRNASWHNARETARKRAEASETQEWRVETEQPGAHGKAGVKMQRPGARNERGGRRQNDPERAREPTRRRRRRGVRNTAIGSTTSVSCMQMRWCRTSGRKTRRRRMRKRDTDAEHRCKMLLHRARHDVWCFT